MPTALRLIMLFLVPLSVEATESSQPRGAGPPVTWTNSAGGLWTTPGNWSTDSVPGAADDVVIGVDGAYTVTLNGDATVRSLTLSAPSGDVTLRIGGSSFTRLTVGEGLMNSETLLLQSSSTSVADLTVTTGTLTNTGLIEISPGPGPTRPSARRITADVDNQAMVNVDHSLDLTKPNGILSNRGILQIADAKTLRALSGVQLENATSGIVRGTGILNVSSGLLTNSGQINPGFSPGILRITGSMRQNPDGAVNIEIGGPEVGAQHDQLTVSGVATLNGALNASLLNDFQPALGQQFRALTFASRTGAFPGFGGATSVNAGGLCMSVEALGANVVGWVSPERYFDLIDSTVYRARVTASTNQTRPDEIPLWFFIYDNFNVSGLGNNYGGFAWVLDVDGGAEGIGRPQGRSQFDFWFTPNAIATPQWRSGAFTPATDPHNDPRLQFRIIDANPTLLTDNDSGTICFQGLAIESINRSHLQVLRRDFHPRIRSAIHFAGAVGETGFSARINDADGSIEAQLSVTGNVRMTAGYFDPTLVNLNAQLYPVVWLPNTLYRMRMSMRARDSEADPVDAIFTALDVTTNELGVVHYTTSNRGQPVMDRAASPKFSPSMYEAYFYSQNVTQSLTPDAARLRPIPFIFNTGLLFGDGTGGDAFVIEDLQVDRLIFP